MKRNKMIALGLSAVMALSLATCGNVNDSKLQPPNPFAEYETLADMEKEPSRKVMRFPYVRRIAAAAACLAMVLVGALTLPGLFQSPEEPVVLSPGDGIVQVSSVEELAERVGFAVNEWNSLPFQVEETTYTAYWQELAQIVYSGGGQTAVYRKGTGSEDVSGDYNAYETETKIFVGDTLVTLKGNGGTYALAVWRDGDYACSISVSEGMSENSWEALLTSGLPENQQGRSR